MNPNHDGAVHLQDIDEFLNDYTNLAQKEVAKDPHLLMGQVIEQSLEQLGGVIEIVLIDELSKTNKDYLFGFVSQTTEDFKDLIIQYIGYDEG